MKINKDFREKPLLKPPDEVVSPWLELKKTDIEWMYQGLEREWLQENPIQPEENIMFMNFAIHAASMKKLGLDVSRLVQKFMPRLFEGMRRMVGDGQYRVLMRTAAGMKTLDIDVEKVVEENEERIEKQLYNPQSDSYFFRLQDFDAAKELGFDVSEMAQKHEKKMREYLVDLRGRGFLAQTAAQMKRVGIDVSAEVKTHEEEIRHQLDDERKNGGVFRFVTHAADMAELGLLNPNPAYRRVRNEEMPPLKKVIR